MEVYETNDGGKIPLTWSKIKNMPLTHRVWYLIYTCMVNAMQKNKNTCFNHVVLFVGNIGKSKDGKYYIIYF
jgi:hypothetical protein